MRFHFISLAKVVKYSPKILPDKHVFESLAARRLQLAPFLIYIKLLWSMEDEQLKPIIITAQSDIYTTVMTCTLLIVKSYFVSYRTYRLEYRVTSYTGRLLFLCFNNTIGRVNEGTCIVLKSIGLGIMVL